MGRGNSAHIIRDSFLTRRPFEASLLASDTLKGLECFEIEVSIGEFSAVVGKEVVGEEVSGRVDSKLRERPSEEAPVGRDRVIKPCAAEGVHDGQIVAIGT